MLLCQLSGTPKVVAYVISLCCRCCRCRRVNVIVSMSSYDFDGGQRRGDFELLADEALQIRPDVDHRLAFSYTAVQSSKQTGKNSCRSDCLNENTLPQKIPSSTEFLYPFGLVRPKIIALFSFLVLCLRTVVLPQSTRCRQVSPGVAIFFCPSGPELRAPRRIGDLEGVLLPCRAAARQLRSNSLILLLSRSSVILLFSHEEAAQNFSLFAVKKPHKISGSGGE